MTNTEREGEAEARKNGLDAYLDSLEYLSPSASERADVREQWDVAWAAATAVFSYMMEGRSKP